MISASTTRVPTFAAVQKPACVQARVQRISAQYPALMFIYHASYVSRCTVSHFRRCITVAGAHSNALAVPPSRGTAVTGWTRRCQSTRLCCLPPS